MAKLGVRAPVAIDLRLLYRSTAKRSAIGVSRNRQYKTHPRDQWKSISYYTVLEFVHVSNWKDFTVSLIQLKAYIHQCNIYTIGPPWEQLIKQWNDISSTGILSTGLCGTLKIPHCSMAMNAENRSWFATLQR